MASSRDSQHHLILEDSIDTQYQEYTDPLNDRPTDPYSRHHPTFKINSAVPIEKRDSTDRTATPPRDTHGVTQSPHSLRSSNTHVCCPNRAPVLHKRLSWGPIILLVLAFYATVLSGIFLGVALSKPRWHAISSTGSLSPSTASSISSLLAKTIELSYVTVCVAFLGQVLSRRALMSGSEGISISDMNMRVWIMQPGSMIVHWEALQFSALTLLGLFALISTFAGMLYTTAAQALVAPKLSLGPIEPRILHGKVAASFANPFYLASDCETPITISMDPVYRNATCLQIEHLGHAYYNYQRWTSQWNKLVNNSNSTFSELQMRPKPPSLGCKNHSKCSIWDNTTITGSWIDIPDPSEGWTIGNPMINNVTMAMPHAGIPAAAQDLKNNIKQPTEASGEGKYTIEASVPSPALNVLCVGMSKKELEPLVYSSWPGGSKFDSSNWTVSPPDDIPRYPSWLNRTVYDDLFEFGPEYGQRPPIFGKYPEPYNTITNTTMPWPANAIYLLGATAPSTDSHMPQYVMCSMRAKQTGACSTKYFADTSAAFLSTDCENKANYLRYSRRYGGFQEGLWEPDWKNVASEWASALELNAGISDGNASNARILMQMMPWYNKTKQIFELSPSLPSIAEALAVMAGSTLILGSQDTTFLQGWKYSGNNGLIEGEPVYEAFNGSFQSYGYASGGTEQWDGIFYVVLVLVLLTSFVCLFFMTFKARGQQVTDFTEPQNMFALAMNSPPTEKLRGACGCGPSKNQMKEKWFIGVENGDEHYYIRSKAEEDLLLARKPIDLTYFEPMEIGDGDGRTPSATVNKFGKSPNGNSLLARLY